MGTWGTAIFSDDLAADVKDDFKDKIAAGKTPIDATNELIAENPEILEDSDDAAVFWLALAATQWKLGRLLDFVQQKALDIIESGQELERWGEDEKQLNQRIKVLEKLKVQLLSDQPVPKKLYPRFISETKLEVGDLVLYKHPSGKNAYLKVVGISEDKDGRSPNVQVLNHFSKELIDVENITALEVMTKSIQHIIGENTSINTGNKFYLGSYSKRHGEPWNNLEVLKKGVPFEDNNASCWFVWWKDFDEYLVSLFENNMTTIIKQDGIFKVVD